MLRIPLSILLWAIFSLSISAQKQGKHLLCGTKPELTKDIFSSLEELKQYQKFAISFKKKNYKKKVEMDTISVKLHIIRKSDGSDITSMDDILKGFAKTNEKFAAAGMYFSICPDEITYIDDSSTQPYNDETEDRIIQSENLHPNAVDMFYIGKFEQEGLGGYFTRNSKGYYLVMGTTNWTTVSHELGHYYSLAHTHGIYNTDPPDYDQADPMTAGFPTEVYVEGAVRYYQEMRDDNGNSIFDCLETGDRVCDTPAEPVRVGGNEFLDPRTCQYSGTLTDFYGDQYSPHPGNIMSYGNCFGFDEIFTSGQTAAMRYFLERQRLSELCGYCTEESKERIVITNASSGKGSLLWAIQCDAKSGGEVNIKFNLPEGDEPIIDLDNERLRILASKVSIDGQDISTGENIVLRNGSLDINASQVNLKNIILDGALDHFASLILDEQGCEAKIENVDISNAQRGIYTRQVSSLILNQCFISKTKTAISAQNTDYIEIGGEDIESKNIFAYNERAISFFQVESYSFGINEFYCNESSHRLNDIPLSGLNLKATSTVISGNGQSGQMVHFFKNGKECERCEAQEHIGTIEIDESGEFAFPIDEKEFLFGDKISAYLTGESGASQISNCIFVDVPVGCEEPIADFNFLEDFESIELDIYKTLGADISLYELPNCEPNENKCLLFKGRGSLGTESQLYSQNFDLTDAAFALLSFDLAHGFTFTNRQSSMEIEISIDCGKTYENIYNKSSFTGLITSFDNAPNEDFLPESCEAWRTETIDINRFAGKDIIIRYKVSLQPPFGQNIYIDNIRLEKGLPCPKDNNSDNHLFVQIDKNQKTFCSDLISSINFSFQGPQLSWTVNNGDFQTEELSFTPQKSGQYVAKVTDSFGCEVKDSIDIQIIDIPNFDLGEDKSACRNEFEILELLIQTPDLNYRWFKNLSLIEDATNQNFTPIESAGYIGEAYTENGCNYSDTINITIHEQPEINLPDDILACPEVQVELNLKTEATRIHWFLNDELLVGQNANQLTTTESGIFGVEATSEFGCTSSDHLTVERSPNIFFNNPIDTAICEGEKVSLFVPIVDSISIAWQKNDLPINNNTNELIADIEGRYSVNVIDQFGCEFGSKTELKVHSIPEGKISVESLDFCQGDNTMISAEANAPILHWKLNGVIIEGANETNLIVSATGMYEVTFMNTEGCVSTADVTLDFHELPIVDLGEEKLFCRGNDNMIGMDSGSEIYQWYFNGELINASKATIEPTKTGMYRLVATNTNGCTAEDEIFVDVVDGPQLLLDEAVSICPEDTYEVNVQSEAVYYQWFLNDQQIFEGRNGSISLTNEGEYELKAFGNTGCEASARIVVNHFSTPNFRLDEQYEYCENEFVQITAQTNETFQYKWNVGGNVLPDNSSSIRINEEGSHFVDVTNNFGCTVRHKFSTSEITKPTIEIASDFDLCNGQIVTLEPQVTDSELQYFRNGQNIGSGASIDINSGGEILIAAMNSAGCRSDRSINITERISPEIDLLPEYQLCPEENLILNAGEQSRYEWNNGQTGASIEIAHNTQETIISENFSVTVFNDFGCSSSFVTEVKHIPFLNATIEAQSEHICLGEETNLNVIGGEIFEWLENEEMSQSITVSPQKETAYRVVVGDQCPINQDTLSVTISVSDGADYFISSDTCITSGSQIQLEVSGAEYVEWTPHSSFDTELNVFNPIVSPERDHTYQVLVVDAFGCEFNDAIEVCVGDLYDVFQPPNILTPKTIDNANDALLFQGLKQYPGSSLVVMNRWGGVVFSHDNYQQDDRLFIGISNDNKELESGNYFYILNVNGFDQAIRSSLTIIK